MTVRPGDVRRRSFTRQRRKSHVVTTSPAYDVTSRRTHELQMLVHGELAVVTPGSVLRMRVGHAVGGREWRRREERRGVVRQERAATRVVLPQRVRVRAARSVRRLSLIHI